MRCVYSHMMSMPLFPSTGVFPLTASVMRSCDRSLEALYMNRAISQSEKTGLKFDADV